jgi:lysophospholipase L1-like esterase
VVNSIRGRGASGGSVRERAAPAPAPQGDQSTAGQGQSWLPGWLRAVLLLPSLPRPMAHPDRHAAEAARHMAHPSRKSPLASLASLVSFDAPDHDEGSTSTLVRRRFLPSEPRRREVLAVLSMLFVAALFSVTGPIAGAGSTRPTPSGDMAIVDTTPDTTPDTTASPTETGAPAATYSPEPSVPPTSTPTARPRPAPAKKPAPKPVKVRTFVALGDSLTAWPSTPWPTRLDAEDSGIKLVKNAGVPGNTTAQMRARLSSDVYAYDPDVLFVLGGTNDLGLGVSESATIANLRAILVGAKSHKIAVILLLVPPDSYTSMAPEIDSLNAAIVTLARSQHVTYVDIHTPLTNSNGVYYSKYTSDGLHFSDLGAQTVANTVRARIKLLGL